MNKLNRQQLITLNTLVSKLNIDKESKAIMVSGFSGQRCSSSKDLFTREAAAMISHLNALAGNNPVKDEQANKMRRKIIAYAHEMHWHIAGTQRINMDHLNNWCKQYGMYKKELNKHSLAELPNLLTQFEFVHKDFLSKL